MVIADPLGHLRVWAWAWSRERKGGVILSLSDPSLPDVEGPSPLSYNDGERLSWIGLYIYQLHYCSFPSWVNFPLLFNIVSVNIGLV